MNATTTMITTTMMLYANVISRCFGYRCGYLPVPALCHNCTYLFDLDLLAMIEFRLESSRAAGVLREEISRPLFGWYVYVRVIFWGEVLCVLGDVP